MIEGKSFRFLDSYWEAMRDLTYEQRGQFVSAMCTRAFDGEEPDVEDPAVAFGSEVVRELVSDSLAYSYGLSVR